jgi:hypothetical protein
MSSHGLLSPPGTALEASYVMYWSSMFRFSKVWRQCHASQVKPVLSVRELLRSNSLFEVHSLDPRPGVTFHPRQCGSWKVQLDASLLMSDLQEAQCVN